MGLGELGDGFVRPPKGQQGSSPVVVREGQQFRLSRHRAEPPVHPLHVARQRRDTSPRREAVVTIERRAIDERQGLGRPPHFGEGRRADGLHQALQLRLLRSLSLCGGDRLGEVVQRHRPRKAKLQGEVADCWFLVLDQQLLRLADIVCIEPGAGDGIRRQDQSVEPFDIHPRGCGPSPDGAEVVPMQAGDSGLGAGHHPGDGCSGNTHGAA